MMTMTCFMMTMTGFRQLFTKRPIDIGIFRTLAAASPGVLMHRAA
jgi:hypothetical protein